MPTLSIDRCPAHGRHAVSLNDQYGGSRLTSGKCCGLWRTLHEWDFTEHDLENLIAEAKRYLADAKKQQRLQVTA